MTKSKSSVTGEANEKDKKPQAPAAQKAVVEDRLDEELEETFPASDAPSITRPGAGREPVHKEKTNG